MKRQEKRHTTATQGPTRRILTSHSEGLCRFSVRLLSPNRMADSMPIEGGDCVESLAIRTAQSGDSRSLPD